MKKYIIIFFTALSVSATICIAQGNNGSVSVSTKQMEDTISIIGVGDLTLGTNYPSNEYLPPDDGKNILVPVKDVLTNADITFGNFDCVLLTGTGTVKKCNNPSVCFAFKCPDYYVTYMKEAGFDIISVANNHSGDFGDAGRRNTVRLFKENNIEYAGLTYCPYTIFERNNVKYGFCAFAPNNGTISLLDRTNAMQIVRKLDSICDIVIVSMHTGAEGPQYTHITKKNEIFLGENRGNPYQFARDVIDAGADIVFGSGPHVTRAMDLYKGRFIAYSLGNFATYGRFNLKGPCGIAPIVKLIVNKKGEFLHGSIISIKQIGRGGPVIDPEQKVVQEVISLNKSDIPDTPLMIDQNGVIRKK